MTREVVVMKTRGTAKDYKVGIMATLGFQWKHKLVRKIISWKYALIELKNFQIQLVPVMHI